MSARKASLPQASPPPVGGVDFLVRTMIEREATGKRPIRPKNVEDLLHSSIQDESDDPDFDFVDADSDSCGTGVSDDDEDGGSDGSGSGNGENGEGSDESDDEDFIMKKGKEDAGSSENDESGSSGSGSDSSGDESNDSDSDDPDMTKKSALRETLQKLNESSSMMAKKPRKKKRKLLKSSGKSKPKTTVGKNTTQKKSSSNLEKQNSKSSKMSKKGSKNKKTVIAKKRKVVNKKPGTEKKKKRSKKSGEKSKSKLRSIASLIDDVAATQKENRKEIELTKPICSACLGDKSDDSNEIVECDSCGISVHEICYGLSADNLSISSGSGSSSCTEPWFCDVCKSGSENMNCELCPVEGGLFKESTAGRWIHLVCAMYTQGVALHNDSSINLYEIQYARWGSHSCAACENERQAQTGIVIPCDAGMCKTYFHATCAQKLGLLSDPNQVDFAEADPYYVSCKLHTNRETVKRRIKIFNMLQEQLRIKKERKEVDGLPSGANADQARILRKLEKVRKKTALKRAHYLNSLENSPPQESVVDQIGFSALHNLPSSWINGNKKQRLMHTSAKLGNDFLRKTDRLGEDIIALELEVKHEKIVSNVKRKWNVLPAMSVEYAAYYADRENRISQLVDQCDKSVKENAELIDKEISLKDVWETHVVNQMAMSEETESVSEQLESLVSILNFMCPGDKKLTSKFQSLIKRKDLTGGRRKSPSMSKGDRKSPSPRRSSTTGSKKSQKNRVLSPSPSRAGKMAIAVCATCSNSNNQHLITRCDKCRKHYHLSCLDPPLSRMPKRSRLCGWMCSDCCETPSENDDQVDTEAPRTLRGRTKIRKPGKYRGSDESDDDSKPHPDPEKQVLTKRSPVQRIACSSDAPEPKVNSESLTIPVTNISKSPSERRRRSGSSVKVPTPLLSNSSSVDLPAVQTDQIAANPSTVLSNIEVITPLAPNIAREPKPVKKKRTSAKALKSQQNQLITSTSGEPTYEIDTIKSEPILPQKRKSSDGPLTTFKVNGINETQVTKNEDIKATVPKPNKRKKKASNTLGTDDLSKNGIFPVVANVLTSKKNNTVPKVRKKKEVAKNAVVPSDSNPATKIENSTLPLGKTKKPRKKKEKPGEVKEANDTKDVEKKKRKPAKPRVSTQSTKLAARDEKNGVNLVMGKVTSQFLHDKMKEIKNGAVKMPASRKRKSSTVSNSSKLATPTETKGVLDVSLPDEKEKEKCVPPKKRKRAPSSAQQPNSIDSIIKAVSVGNFSDNLLENGDRGLEAGETTTVMQGITSVNRQLVPEQNIMQGNAMGSGPGVGCGETVTVDASFIIDGPAPLQTSFGAGNSGTTTTFYSSNHHSPVRSGQEEHAVLKLSGVVNEGFQIHAGGSGSNNGDNVIRLQYIDSGGDAALVSSDAVAMPPPAPPVPNSTVLTSSFPGVCASCIKTDHKDNLVMCDKCQLEFHFLCLNPPLEHNPRRKGCPWFCKNCDDEAAESAQTNGIARY